MITDDPPRDHPGGYTCRWPIGDPRSPGFTFCGCDTARWPYCEPHARVAYLERPSPQKEAKLMAYLLKAAYR